MAANLDSNQEAGRLWEQMRQEKAAGGYPWTHLSHNEEEEVWIDPLCLPQDISRETMRRRDGTIPSEWFHLPEGTTPPTVEELLREDSPELEEEIVMEETQTDQQTDPEVAPDRKTPTGRRTPICGRHRHRHKSSAGSSPAPSQRSGVQPASSIRTEHQRNESQPDTGERTMRDEGGGYEPVGAALGQSQERPETRSPSSQLPEPPSGDDTDTTQGCFLIRKHRSRLKEKKQKKPLSTARSHSQDQESLCSEHNYETPKLLQKSPKSAGSSPPSVNRGFKPNSNKKQRSDLEDGYEPVGSGPVSMETWIAEKDREFTAVLISDADIRNIERKLQNKEKMEEREETKIEVDDVAKEKEELGNNKRSLSDSSDKSRNIAKELKKKKIEEDKLLKEQLKREKAEKEAEEKEERKKQKEERKLIEKTKFEKQKEDKQMKEQDEMEKKRVKKQEEDEKKQKLEEEKKLKLQKENEERELLKKKDEENKHKLEEEKKQKFQKEIEEKEIQKQKNEEKKMKIEEEKRLKLLKENEEKEARKQLEEEKKRIKEQKEEKRKKQKLLEEERKRDKEKQKQEEKDRKALAKIEKEKQSRELREHLSAEKAKTVDGHMETELVYADEDTTVVSHTAYKAAVDIIFKEEDEDEALDEEEMNQSCPPSPDMARVGDPPLYEQVGATPQTSQMALRPRTPAGREDGKYVSVVTTDEFSSFSGHNGHNGHGEDEEIDFTPQNGYLEPDDTEVQYEEVGPGSKKSRKKAPAAKKSDLLVKIAAAGSAMKKARLPSPGELKEGYLNSAFHKSLHQPLVVKVKVERDSVRAARQALTQERTPVQLGNIESMADFPLPKIKKSKVEVEGGTEETTSLTMPKNFNELGQAAFNTLPKSLRAQNIVTAVKENLDPEELARNQELTRSKTPAELAQIHSLAEFPVPDKIKNLLTFERRAETLKKEPKKRRHSVSEPEEEEGPPEPFSLYSTLPRSLRETKLVTNVKVETDEEKVKMRQALVESRTPAQLSTIASISDLPIPSKLTRLMGGSTHAADTHSNGVKVEGGSTAGSSKMKLNERFSTLPRALTMELAVKTKVNDPAVVEQRRALMESKTPMQLGNIGSISDLPIPAPISNLYHKINPEDTPTKPERRNVEEKRKRNLTTGTFLASDFLPESWRETKLLVRTKVEEDDALLKSRQELVAGKSVSELGQIHGFSDLPVPTRVQTLLRSKKRVLKSTEEKEGVKRGVSRSVTSLPTISLSSLTHVPNSLKSELLVKSVVEDQELVAKNKEIIKTTSVSELSRIGTLSDIPIPENIENLIKKIKSTKTDKESEGGSDRPQSPSSKSLGESIYESLPRSLRETQLLVKSKFEEDEEKLRERQELTRTKSPTELSQISSISDLPIPQPVQNLLKKKSEQDPDSPIPPPRKWRKEDIYDSIPSSLKSELIVRSREMDDPEQLEARRELIRTQTPAQLSVIHGLSDIPLPTFIENMVAKKDTTETTEKPKTDDPEKVPFSVEKIYDTLPKSLTETKLITSSTVEDPELQAARAEVVKSKSVSELSKISSFADFPVPETIENFVKTLEKKHYGPAERRKKIKEQTKSKSTQSLSAGVYASLPRSLKRELAVKTVEEDPSLVAERMSVLASKSVSELSQVTSLSDIPVPSVVARVFHKSMERLSSLSHTTPQDSRPVTPGGGSIQENIYATLPKSLKSELLVCSVVEDPETAASRRELTQSKSVSELSQIRSLSDIPIPENLEKLMSRTATNSRDSPVEQSSRPATSLSMRGLKDEMYASLPRSLKDQLIVRTKVETDESVLLARQALVESKSPAELSQIHSLGELPIPSRIEAWLHGTGGAQTNGCEEESPLALPRNTKELQEAIYRGLPASLTQPVVVRSKVEDPTVLLERQQLQQTKSIHELSKIRNINEIPIPGNFIKLPDVPLPKMKNILNFIARPPPRAPRNGTPKSETYQSYELAPGSETLESTPLTDDRQFHSPLSSEGLESPVEERYEEIESRVPVEQNLPAPPPAEEEEEEDQFSLAEQIRGTPERSMRKDKKKKNRRSADSAQEEVISLDSSIVSGREEVEEVPPPLPPKRVVTPSPKKQLSLESQPSFDEEIEAIPVKGILSLQAVDGNIQVVRNEIQKNWPQEQPLPPRREKQSSSAEPREISEKAIPDPVQSRPLPAPPAPPRSLKKKSASVEEAEDRSSNTASPTYYRDRTETENFRTCHETLETSKTLLDSANRPQSSLSSDITLADSCLDSLVSCAETLVGDNDNLETCAETLRDEDQTQYYSDDDLDNPYPAVDFDSMMAQGPGAGATVVERPGRTAKKSESGRRLEEGTQQLSLELMEHVESLKTTLDNMSSRLGTRSRSRSHSKSRHSSQYRPSDQQ